MVEKKPCPECGHLMGTNNGCRRAECRKSERPQPVYEMTFSEIAEKLGMTRQRVTQIYDGAMEKLRRTVKRERLDI